jgi:type IV secretory pathway component VirB8
MPRSVRSIRPQQSMAVTATPPATTGISSGAARAGTIEYEARFYKTEAKEGASPRTQPWTATVDFQFHPKLAISSQDVTLNPDGLQVGSYSAFPDPAP